MDNIIGVFLTLGYGLAFSLVAAPAMSVPILAVFVSFIFQRLNSFGRITPSARFGDLGCQLNLFVSQVATE